jgi:ATP-dependent Lhr-like helicase
VPAIADVAVGVRSGDTTTAERRKLATSPPDILITTPESLFLMLTSQARESLRGVETVIVDEVHAVAGTKRGAHLAVSLERLDELLERPAQRIGLSATVAPGREVARFLGGAHRGGRWPSRRRRKWGNSRSVVPVEDMTEARRREEEVSSGSAAAMCPAHLDLAARQERVSTLVRAARSTIVLPPTPAGWPSGSPHGSTRSPARPGRGGMVSTGSTNRRPPAEIMAQSGQSGRRPHH